MKFIGDFMNKNYLNKSKIAVLGFDNPEIKSIDRKESHYKMALNQTSTWKQVTVQQLKSTWRNFDYVLDFNHSLILENWKPPIPCMVLMHGTIARNFDPYPYEQNYIFTKSDMFIVECNSDKLIAEKCINKNGPKIILLPLAYDKNIFYKSSKRDCRIDLGLNDDDKYLLYVGRLIAPKNIHLVLKILYDLKGSNNKIKLIIIGEYEDYLYFNWISKIEYKNYITTLIQKWDLFENIIFIGKIDEDYILQKYYCASDIVINLSTLIDENFGYSNIEALACGTPVVSTLWGGFKDTVGVIQSETTINTWYTQTGVRIDLDNAYRTINKILNSKCKYFCSSNEIQLNEFELQKFKNRFESIIKSNLKKNKIIKFNSRNEKYLQANKSYIKVGDKVQVISKFNAEKFGPNCIYYSSISSDNLFPNKNYKAAIELVQEDANIFSSLDPCWPFQISFQKETSKELVGIINKIVNNEILDLDNFKEKVKYISYLTNIGIIKPCNF
jgi:glycosyltransferase involved in cell wall biosynthesis